MMKKKVGFLYCFLVIGGLVSCNIPAQYMPVSTPVEVDEQYRTVSVLLTQTAQIVPVSLTNTVVLTTPAPVAVIDSTVVSDSSVTLVVPNASPAAPTVSNTPAFTHADGKALAAPCDLAQLGYPIDISVPDGSRFWTGEYFSKTWRLVNAGSCHWTRDYALVWFSGDGLGLNQVQPLGVEVLPGASVDVTVDMVAPMAPGTYQSNWKMRNTAGEMFGIGPSGDAPFWVRIAVVPLDTPTVTPTDIYATPTPGIYASGSITLGLGEGLDLDSAQINQAQEDDLLLQNPQPDEIQLAPLAGARLVPFGMGQPQLFDCNENNSNTTPVVLAQDIVGASLCYRTTLGLPGRITIKSVDLEKGQVDLEFITWVVP